MLFKKREDYLGDTVYAAADGIFNQTVRYEITREFPIDTIWIALSITSSGAFGGGGSILESYYNVLKRVQLQVADGSRTRNVVDATGVGLAEYARNMLGGLDRGYMFRRYVSEAGAITWQGMIPIFFAHPQISDPVSSSFLLPAHRYNANPVLTIQTAPKAEMTAAAITFTGQIGVLVERREVDRPDWAYYDTEIFENPWNPVAGLQSYDLPIPGALTAMQIRATSAGVRVNPCAVGAENRLQYLGNVIRRWRMEDLQRRNEVSNFFLPNLRNQSVLAAANTNIPNLVFTDVPTMVQDAGLYFHDFLTDRVGESVNEIGSALETNFLMASGARVQWLANITGTPTINILFHRILGDISPLKFGNRK